jgi:diguanylate cyclase (GGDEF)-like protein
MLFIDIVKLKHINIRYGRQTGDEVIRAVARSTTSALGSGDILFRYAGDEFVALLRNPDIPAADALAREIRHRVSVMPLSLTERPQVDVTVDRIRNPRGGESLRDLIASRDPSSAQPGKKGNPSVH